MYFSCVDMAVGDYHFSQIVKTTEDVLHKVSW